MALKINKLEIENVKRIKAVKLEPKENGLTIIGGNNISVVSKNPAGKAQKPAGHKKTTIFIVKQGGQNVKEI